MSTSKSGTKWAIDEEVQLCKSWATITSYGSTGKDQDAKHLWRNIHNHYQQNWEGVPSELRSLQALESRWKNLKRNLGSWHDAVTKAENYYQSGANNMDKVSTLANFISNLYLRSVLITYNDLFNCYLLIYNEFFY